MTGKRGFPLCLRSGGLKGPPIIDEKNNYEEIKKKRGKIRVKHAEGEPVAESVGVAALLEVVERDGLDHHKVAAVLVERPKR